MRSSGNTLTILLVAAVLLICVIVYLAATWPSPSPKPRPELSESEARELLRTWNLGVLSMDRFEFAPAARAFQAVADRLPDEPDVLANYGIAVMNQDTDDSYRLAEEAFRSALALNPRHKIANHCFGVLLRHLGRNDEAERHFRILLEQDPHDASARYYLATILVQRSELEEAESHLRASIEAEPHQASAIKNLFAIYYRKGMEEEAKPLVELFQEFQRTETGNLAGIVYGEMGRYGSIERDFPVHVPEDAAEAAEIRFVALGLDGSAATAGSPRPSVRNFTFGPDLTTTAQLARLLLSEMGGGVSIADVNRDGLLDLWIADPETLGTLYINEGGVFRDATAEWGLQGSGGSVSATFGDFDQDGQVDLYICCPGRNRLFLNWGNRFTEVTGETGTAGDMAFTSQAVMADFDSDGDLDIYAAQLFAISDEPVQAGLRWPEDIRGSRNQLFNNNRDGTFTDIGGRAAVSGGSDRTQGVLAASFGRDRDADILLLNAAGPVRLYRNDRLWRFVDVTSSSRLGDIRNIAGATAADLTGDLSLDLLLAGPAGAPAAYGERRPLTFERLPLPPIPAGSAVAVLDLDNDGDLDILSLSADGALAWLRQRDGSYRRQEIESLRPYSAHIRTLAAADFDGDGRLDLVATRLGAPPLLLRNETETGNRWIGIELRGVREEGKMRANAGGVGSRVTVIAGARQQIADVATNAGVLGGASQRLHFGLGRAPQVDVLSIRWPDDLLQGEGQISAGQVRTLSQVYRKSSSCPLLFAWDGDRFHFVTDFLGVGGLGFFLEPGVYAPPDPTERVLIPHLEPKDGRYVISIHEPMEEILYLDEAFLWAIDHPQEFEVHPDERLALGGPPPADRFFVTETAKRQFPKALSTLEGPGDPAILREADRVYQPGVKPDRRFLGYAAPQEITLDFGEFLAGEQPHPIVLFIDGWVEYPYSHVNFAAYQAGLKLRGISIDVEKAPGRWECYIEEFGYPAGMPRIMTFEMAGLPSGGTGRIRLRTNLELYMDRVWLGLDRANDPAVRSRVKTVRIDACSAILRQSGYPREYSPDGREPLLYDYALMDPAIDYKTMTGFYTRFGDVRPLLARADDQSVIMGRAEEILMTFPALPPADPGTRRTFVLDSTGFCKDMDLYSAFPHTVEPLPFLGMSNYPPPPGEAFPDTPEIRAYRDLYNTRHLSGAVPAPAATAR